MIYEDALDLDDVSLSILPTENQTSGSAIRYQLQSPRSYQFVYLLSSILDINFLRKIRNLGRYNHSHTINSTVVILELKLSLFFYQKKKEEETFLTRPRWYVLKFNVLKCKR